MTYWDGSSLQPFDSYYAKARELFIAFWRMKARITRDQRLEASDLASLEAVEQASTAFYPYVYSIEVDGSSRLNVLVLMSSDHGTNVITNAMGLFTAPQLAKVQSIIAYLTEPIVLATHHHVGFPAEARLNVIDRSLCIRDGAYLLGLAAKSGRHFVLFNGHRHIGYHARTSHVEIVSGASSTMGDEARGYIAQRLENFSPIWDNAREARMIQATAPQFGIYELVVSNADICIHKAQLVGAIEN
jgi:hypothetical protein